MSELNAQLGALIGIKLGERFELRGILGHGGMGAVFDGWDHQFEAAVAIKIILPSLTTHAGHRAELMARFRREAKNTFQLRHQHIVTVTDFGEDVERQMLFLVMEKLIGSDLDDELREAGRLPPRRVVKILGQACMAIDHAHQANQIHRDLKPSNLMLIKRGRDADFVKVLDFGLARSETGEDKLSRTGQMLGTPHYMAPEQIDGHNVDRRCDIYAMGAVAYHLLSGHVPFPGATLEAVLHAQKHARQQRLCDVVPGLPQALSDAVDRALHKRPDARYLTMEDFRDALESAVRAMPAGAAVTPPLRMYDVSPPWSDDPPVPPAVPLPAPSPQRKRVAVTASAEVVTAQAGGLSASRPVLVTLGDSTALLYEHTASGVSRIAWQRITPELAAGPPVILTRAPAIALAPAAAGTDGRAFVAWVDVRSGKPQVRGGPWAPADSARIADAALGAPSDHVGPLAIAATPFGAIVTWHEVSGGRAIVFALAVDPVGGASEPFRAAGACPAISVGGEGVLLAWHDAAVAGQARSIHLCAMSRVTPYPATVLRWPHGAPAAFPVLAPARDGTLAMLWWCGGPAPAAMLSRISRHGTPISDPIRLGPASRTPHRGSLVAIDDGLVAAWTAPAPDGVVASWMPGDLAGPVPEPTALDRRCPSRACLTRLGDDLVAAWTAPRDGVAALNLSRIAVVAA